MFQTAAGVTVPFPEKLSEQYELDGNTITANLSFEKLSDFVHSFYAELDEPLFLAIHPDAESDEVWYLDGMTKKQLTMILDGYGELLYQDGLSAFAIGSLTTEEELFVQKYKVLSIYSETAKRFVPLLKKYGMEPTGHLFPARFRRRRGRGRQNRLHCQASGRFQCCSSPAALLKAYRPW